MLTVQEGREMPGEEGGMDNFLKIILSLLSCSSTPLLEQPLPPVLNQLVNEFSQHMKQQTSTGDEINKFSDRAMEKVQQETGSQRQVRVYRSSLHT